MWLFIVGVAFGSFALGYVAVRIAFKGKPGVQPKWSGLLIGGATMVGVLALNWVLGRFGISLFRPNTSASTLFWIATSVVMLFALVVHAWKSRHAGAVLLDLGKGRRVFFLAIGSLCFVASIGPIATGSGSFWQAVMNLELAALFLMQAFTPFQLREQGIQLNQGLVPWRKLKSYYWSKSDTLTISTRSWPGWNSRFELQVPPEHVGSINQILSEHTPLAP